MKARPLVFFTLCAQAAAGIFLAAVLLQILLLFRGADSSVSGAALYRLSTTLLALSLLLMCVALPVSLAHLGSPARACRAARNFAHSWLSREIVFSLLFTLFVCLSLLATLFPRVLSATIFTSLIGGTVCGVMLLLSMGHLYRQRTILSWNSTHTLWTPALTALGSGGLVAAIGLVCLNPDGDAWGITAAWILAGSAAAAIALQILNQGLRRLRAAPANPLHPGQRLVPAPTLRPFLPGMLSLLLALLAASLAFWLSGLSWQPLALALCLEMVGETLLRLEFYASYSRTGL